MTHPRVAELEADFPDHELVVYRNTAVPLEGYPNGVQALIAIPKAAIAGAIGAGKPPPFWRHGEVMNVNPPREGEDGAGQDAEGVAVGG